MPDSTPSVQRHQVTRNCFSMSILCRCVQLICRWHGTAVRNVEARHEMQATSPCPPPPPLPPPFPFRSAATAAPPGDPHPAWSTLLPDLPGPARHIALHGMGCRRCVLKKLLYG